MTYASTANVLSPPAITELERDLLRCCLLPPAAAADVWRAFNTTGDPVIPASLQPLLGLLGETLSTAGIRPGPALADRLRAAQMIERQRNDALQEIAGFVVGLPAIGVLRPLIVGGMATATLAWPAPMLRHTSRVALLFPSARAARDAARALTAHGDYAIERSGQWIGSALRLSHRSGMPILFHGGYCAAPAMAMRYRRLLPRAVGGKLAGHDALFGDLASCLALAALDALRDRQKATSLLWLADAVFLLRGLAESERYRHLPPAVMLPLIGCAAGIDPALATIGAAVSEHDAIEAVAALRGMRAALSLTRGKHRLFWFGRLLPGAVVGRVRQSHRRWL